MPKRKLNEKDVPEAAEPVSSAPASFNDFGLEPRLLRGIRDQKWSLPTPVQQKVIRLALDGRDNILARSGTGTGKTAAYLLPILDRILRRTASQESRATSLILVPTRELALQVTRLAQSLTAYCRQDVRIQNIAGKESEIVQRAGLSQNPDIVVGTPARVVASINTGALELKELSHLV